MPDDAHNNNRGQYAVLFGFLALMWAGCGAFALYLWRDARKMALLLENPAYTRDALLAVGAIAAVTLLLSVVWVLIWRAFRSNQADFDRELSDTQRAVPHGPLDTSLPIAFDGTALRINRGLSVQEIPVADLFWLHAYQYHTRRGGVGLMLELYLADGRRHRAAFERANMPGVQDLIEQLRVDCPGLRISRGRGSQAYRICRQAWKNRS